MDKWQKLALETALALASGRNPPRPAEVGDPNLDLEGVITDGFQLYLVDKSMLQIIQGTAKERIPDLARSCVSGVTTQWKLASRLEELARACYLAKDSRAELVYRDKDKQQSTIDAVISTIRAHFNLD